MKMNKILFLGYCVVLNIQFVRGETYTSVINTTSGPLRGLISTTIENKKYAAFKGVPYAKPPVGRLRFKPPVPVQAWTKVYNATSESNLCMQVSFSDKTVLGSEDCLYINIYTPHTKFNEAISKPVMVWIYGGAFSFGESRQSAYGPDFILGEDVIFISFNYRLSAFGFLNLEHENALGNCGLKDQVLALKWVKRNIAKFGGNPDKITIFGESAGSVCVDLHTLSDMFIRQSISMSGSTLNLVWGIQNRKEALENGFKLGSKLGTNTRSKDELLTALYDASASDIITTARNMGFLSFKPSLENPNIAENQEKFLTRCSPEKYDSGNYTKGPHMMGFTADESIFFLGGRSKMAKSVLDSLKNKVSNKPLLSLVANALTTGIEKLTTSAKARIAPQISDLLFVLGIDAKQKLMSRNNNYPIYYYRFSFQSNYSLHKAIGITFEGAAHGDDIPYVFYTPVAKLPLDQPDIATTRRRMVKLWTNFAKYGNPTPNGNKDAILGITWPDSRLNGDHLEIDKDLSTGPRPISQLVKSLQSIKLGESSLLNDC